MSTNHAFVRSTAIATSSFGPECVVCTGYKNDPIHAAPSTWQVTLSSRLNPNDEFSAPRYGLPVVVSFRTRTDARQWIAKFVSEHGLRVLASVPSRHGILCEPGVRGTARYSYGIRKAVA